MKKGKLMKWVSNILGLADNIVILLVAILLLTGVLSFPAIGDMWNMILGWIAVLGSVVSAAVELMSWTK